MKLRAALFIAALVCMALLAPATAGAATASWQFEPSSFDFGTRLPAEGPTAAKAFELRNTGEVPLSPAFVSVSSEGGSGFELGSNGCNHALAPGTGCTIEVTFDPSSVGRKEGTLSVESWTREVAAATAQLVGSGGEPIVAIDSTTVTFDTIPIPISSMPARSTRTVRVTNVGSADLSIKGMRFDEEGLPTDAMPHFSIPVESNGSAYCGQATVPPGASCSINLEFSPGSPGTYKAEIGLEDNALGTPQLITLLGTAVAQGPPAPPPSPAPMLASSMKFTRKPSPRSKSLVATFVFSAESSPAGFKCRWTKRGEFHSCASPFHLHELKPGPHVFSVYAVGATGLPGPVRTYRWRVLR